MARLSQLIHPNIIQMFGIVDESMCSLCSDVLIIDLFIILQVLHLSESIQSGLSTIFNHTSPLE